MRRRSRRHVFCSELRHASPTEVVARHGGSDRYVDMLCTCKHTRNMSKMIQVRNVPDQLHRTLKARAAQQGVSLSDFILSELRRVAERVSPQELAERARTIVRDDFTPSPAELLRMERERRSP